MAILNEQNPRSFVVNITPKGTALRIHIYPPLFRAADADGFWKETLEYQIGVNRRIIIKPQGGDRPTVILPEALQRDRYSTKEERDQWLNGKLKEISTAGEVVIQEVDLPSSRQ